MQLVQLVGVNGLINIWRNNKQKNLKWKKSMFLMKNTISGTNFGTTQVEKK